MIRHFSFAIVAAAVAATSLAAQSPSTSSQTPATPNSATSTASTASSTASTTANHVTVTGCIERADQMTSSATNPTADPDSLQYVLVRADAAQGNSGATPAPTGTTGTAGAAAQSRVMYRLSGDQQKLNPHVGHKVEIVGTPTTMASNGTSAATPSAPGASTMPAGPAPGLTVENVRMLDATCAAK